MQQGALGERARAGCWRRRRCLRHTQLSARALPIAACLAASTLAHADEPATSGPFVAGDLVAGALVKAEVAAGWGRRDSSWVGVEALALSTTEFGAIYGGLRGQLSFLDVTLGVRETASYERSLLPVQASYTTTDGGGPDVRYASLDASVTGYVPVPAGYAMLWADIVRPLGLARDERLYEEYERVVVGRGTTVAVRLAYLATLRHGTLLVGPVAEAVAIGGRDATSWRAGAAMFWTLSSRWSVNAVLTTPFTSTDDLGVWDGLWGTAGVRYRWTAPLGR